MDITTLLLIMLLQERLPKEHFEEQEEEGPHRTMGAPPTHGTLGQTPNPSGFLHGALMGPLHG